MAERQSGEKVQLMRLLGKFWTFANVLSLFRLILVIPVTYLIWTNGSRLWLFGLLLLGVATDFFDGYVARRSKTVSDWGKVLDPLADKVAAAMIVTALVVRPVPPQLPLWFLLLIVLRDVLIVLGGVMLARRTEQVVMSAWAGKIAVTGISATVLVALLLEDQTVLLQVCVWVTAVLLVYSFLLYGIRYVRIIRLGRLPEESASGEAPRRTSDVPESADSLG